MNAEGPVPDDTLDALLPGIREILTLTSFRQVGDPRQLEAVLFRGARLDGSIHAPKVAFPGGDELAAWLGRLASLLFRYGNADATLDVARRVARLDPPGRRHDGEVLRLARLERCADGAGRPILARALPTFERYKALQRRARVEGVGTILRAQRSRWLKEMLAEVGYVTHGPKARPELDPTAGALLAWETVTVLREGVLAPVLGVDAAAVPEIRLPMLLHRRTG